MEKEDIKALSDDEIKSQIESLMLQMQSMKSESAEEIERVKGIIRKNVPFFERSAFMAWLLMRASKPAGNKKRADREKAEKHERAQKAERAERPERAEKPNKEEKEKSIPEGAKTIYIDVGKMKHLYPKDLSKRLQAELGITRDDIYMIRIHDKYSFVTMSEENCLKAIEKLTGQDINGRIAKVAFSNK